MKNFTFTGIPVCTQPDLKGRIQFYLVTDGDNTHIRCIFNGHKSAYDVIAGTEEHKRKIRVSGKMMSDITTLAGRRFKVFYPSRIDYDYFTKSLREAV